MKLFQALISHLTFYYLKKNSNCGQNNYRKPAFLNLRFFTAMILIFLIGYIL